MFKKLAHATKILAMAMIVRLLLALGESVYAQPVPAEQPLGRLFVQTNTRNFILSLKKSLAFPPGIALGAAKGREPEPFGPQEENNNQKKHRSTSEGETKVIVDRLRKEHERNIMERDERELWVGNCGSACCTCSPACSAECETAEGPISEGSCNGSDACLEAKGAIRSNSCNGGYACYGADGGVGPSSCNGNSACLQAYGGVGTSSCIGSFVCFFAREPIGDFSCNGPDACRETQGAVADKSCNGGNACNGLQGTVGINSCNGENACNILPLPVGSGSCNGADSCNCADPKSDGTAISGCQMSLLRKTESVYG